MISAVFHSGSSLRHTDSTSLGEGVWAGRGKESSRPVDEHQCPARLRPQQRRGQQQRAGTDGGWMRTAWAREARLSGRSSVCRSASNNVSSLSPPAGAASAGLAVALGSGVTATLRRRRRPRPRRELPPSVLAGLAPGRRQRPAHTGGGTRRPPHCRGAERVGQQQRVVGRRPGGRGNGGRRSALISSRAIALCVHADPVRSQPVRGRQVSDRGDSAAVAEAGAVRMNQGHPGSRQYVRDSW